MNARPLTCERCREPFACGASDPAGCWCMDVDLSTEVRTDLARRFADCLCPACLRLLAGNEKDRPA